MTMTNTLTYYDTKITMELYSVRLYLALFYYTMEYKKQSNLLLYLNNYGGLSYVLLAFLRLGWK